MYAPVSRQLDATITATFDQACKEDGSASASACQGNAAPTQANHPTHHQARYQKASFVQTVQPAPGYAAEAGVSAKLEHAASSLPMILIAAVLLLIPAVAMGFFGNARWPGLLRG